MLHQRSLYLNPEPPARERWNLPDILAALTVGLMAAIFLIALLFSPKTAIAQSVAPVLAPVVASFWESPFMLNIYVLALGTLCTFLLAHATGFVAWVQSKTVSTAHPQAAAVGQRVEGIVANAMIAELKGVATAIAAVGPNPTVTEITAQSAVAKTQALAIAKSQINAQNLMADATAVFGTGLDQHLDTLANKTITTTLMSAASGS